MTNDVSYTTEEISKLLKISKLTVYDLIKKGELLSYRVGKQMRIDAVDLEAYKQRAKGLSNTPSLNPIETSDLSSLKAGTRSIVITGQDISLDILSKHIEDKTTGIRPLRSHVSSLESLISMYKGEADVVSTHLLDGDTGEYNLPYIKRLLAGSSYIVVNLLFRRAGLYVQSNNPKNINHWTDLTQSGLRLINREKGSGARVLLDEQLRMHGIHSHQLLGYGDERSNHLAVATRVASGEADVGVGTEKAASMVDHVEFIPLMNERYDLVMMKNVDNIGWIGSLMDILQSDEYKQELSAISEYDLSQTGQIMLET
ncbi:helix-turn-helix transcriptional regulator [Paenibacillus glacialis]|uniref:Excisionase n=1 Tax=Paenibacillus glacialis TaxID=494026 RepID=A0A162ME10_9BACL|nr:helix-turn-helix transcriptional regulator [Paenibacillus glacialis]OAB42843.1 hypothetical protein PGLA_10295 [Paenibacillus glacialis]